MPILKERPCNEHKIPFLKLIFHFIWVKHFPHSQSVFRPLTNHCLKMFLATISTLNYVSYLQCSDKFSLIFLILLSFIYAIYFANIGPNIKF